MDDQVGCPTWSRDLADALLGMVFKTVSGDTKATGIYHYCGASQVSWFEFARYIIKAASRYRELAVSELLPIATAAYPTPAKRPMYSTLDCSRIKDEFGMEQGDWRRGVEEVVAALLKK